MRTPTGSAHAAPRCGHRPHLLGALAPLPIGALGKRLTDEKTRPRRGPQWSLSPHSQKTPAYPSPERGRHLGEARARAGTRNSCRGLWSGTWPPDGPLQSLTQGTCGSAPPPSSLRPQERGKNTASATGQWVLKEVEHEGHRPTAPSGAGHRRPARTFPIQVPFPGGGKHRLLPGGGGAAPWDYQVSTGWTPGQGSLSPLWRWAGDPEGLGVAFCTHAPCALPSGEPELCLEVLASLQPLPTSRHSGQCPLLPAAIRNAALWSGAQRQGPRLWLPCQHPPLSSALL